MVDRSVRRQSPGYHDTMLVLDSTPVATARSRETVKRAGDSQLVDAIGDAAGYGYCPSHSRFFYGMRLHLLAALDGTRAPPHCPRPNAASAKSRSPSSLADCTAARP